MARAFYSPGRFVDSDGATAVFALPANHPLHRCEPLRPEVEAALGGYFRQMVPLRLAVDDGQVARPPDLAAGPCRTPRRGRAGGRGTGRRPVAARTARPGLSWRRDRRGHDRGCPDER